MKLKNNSGRLNTGQIALKSKKNIKKNNYLLLDPNRVWSTLLGIILKIKLLKNNKLVSLVKYSNGSLSAIKIANGLNIGDFFKSSYLPIRLYKTNLLGFRTFLKLLKVNMIFFDLSKFNSSIGGYAKANGTFSQILKINKDLQLILVKLPSGKKKYFQVDYLCTLGRNNNIFQKFLTVGKAGLNNSLGKNSCVRGVAMNPVDHPHGGRTKTNQPEVSPWGWVTKHSH